MSIAAVAALATLGPYEWKRDRRAAALALLLLSVVILLCMSVWWTAKGQPPIALAVILSALVAAVWLGVVLWREHKFEDLLPSWLNQKFPDAAMFEDDGVQWTLVRGAAPPEVPELLVHLQNNIEAPRTVELRLRDEFGFFLRSGALRLPGPSVVELAPRAHAIVALPFRWDPGQRAKKVRLYCFVSAKGPLAPRNRRKRAEPGPRPVARWAAVLAPLTGFIVTRRGGVYLMFERPAQPALPRGPLLARVDLLERPVLVPTRAPGVPVYRV